MRPFVNHGMPSGLDPADHPWLGEERDPLHSAEAPGALEDVNAEQRVQRLKATAGALQSKLGGLSRIGESRLNEGFEVLHQAMPDPGLPEVVHVQILHPNDQFL